MIESISAINLDSREAQFASALAAHGSYTFAAACVWTYTPATSHVEVDARAPLGRVSDNGDGAITHARAHARPFAFHD
ncbi:MAG: hypothetical protein GY859_41885 [Desulfobacterales bacterium]|nr:hypothetical protein [Desulfobacterales bacterium]